MAAAVFRIRGADIEVRPELGCLRRPDGEEIYLRSKTFQTLQLLLEHRARVVNKDEIARTVWPETAVTDDAVVQCIVEIRKALGDDARTGRYIRTLAKSGYRFVGDVDEIAEVASGATDEERTRALSLEPAVSEPVQASTPRRSMAVAAAIVIAAVLTTAGFVVLRSQKGDAAQGILDALASESGHRNTIAVMMLENQSQTPELEWLREGIADMLVTGLSRSKALSVVGRQHLEVLLDRVGHARGTPVDLAQAIDVAKRARLDHFVVGTFSKLGGTIRIDLRLHDGAGRLVKSEALTIDRPDELLRQVDILGWRLAQHFGELASGAPASTGVLTSNLEAFRHYSLGVSKANAYHNVEAIELFERAAELDPQFALAFARIGYAYGVTWNYEERAQPYLAKAYAMSDRLTEKDRLQVEAWHAVVRFDYPSAVTAFTQLVRAYPTEVEAYSRLGLLLAGERRYDEALQVFQRGLAVDPESGDLWNRLGGVYDEVGRSADAIAARQKYVALQPKEPNAHDSLALSFHVAGRYEDAEASYFSALQLAPDFGIAWIHLGNTYVHLGRYDAADDAYRRYIKSRASSEKEVARGYMNLALLARRRGRVREAVELIRTSPQSQYIGPAEVLIRIAAGEPVDRIADQFPTAPVLGNRGSRLGERAWHHARATLALKRGAQSEAIDLFRAALRERPPLFDADALEDCLANAYLELGRFDEAIAEYERILRLNPRYPLTHYRLALAHEGKGRPDLAQKSFEEFLRVWANADPDVPEIVNARARVAAHH